MHARALLFTLLAAACGSSKPTTTLPAPPPSTADVTAKPAPTPTPPPAATAKLVKVRTVEGISEYRMENGLQVLLFPDDTQSTVTVNQTYLVGSRLEGYGETGMAHLLEHMLFKGTPNHPKVMNLLTERGAQFNGSTWYDRTNYYETLPATQENLDFALGLEADRMLNATISADDLKTEFSVVRNEFEAGENDPSSILSERVVSTAYLWHNYGKSTIGSRADIERVPVPALRAFYEKYYQPDNAVLIVAGKFDEAAAIASIEKFYGSIPKPTRELPKSYTVEPVQDGEREVTLRRNGDVHFLSLAYHTVGAASPDSAAVNAAMDILTRKPSGRLYKKLVETKLASSITAGNYLFRDPWLAGFDVEVRDGKNMEKVEKILVEEIEALGTATITDVEVDRWRAANLKSIRLAFAKSTLIAILLSEYAGLGDWRTLFSNRAAIEKTTAADVKRVAAAYFKRSNRTIGRFIPEKASDRAPLTETPDVAAIVKGIEGGEVADQGEAFVASLENIEARTKRAELKNGIKAAFLPKKTRGGTVELRMAFHWGDEKSLQNQGVVADMVARMLSRGTTKRSYQDLQDFLDVNFARVNVSGDADGFTLSITTVRDKLAPVLDVAAEMLQQPAFNAKELELLKTDRLGKLEQALTDPQDLAVRTASAMMSPWPKGDPRATLLPAEEIAAVKKVTAAQLKTFHKNFVGGGHAELAVVGDFDQATVSTQVEKLFGTWTSKKPYARLAAKPFGVAGGFKSVEIKDKENTVVFGGHDLAMRDTDADYAAWLLVGHVLGGDQGSRLWMRIREAEGLSYGVAAWTSAGALDEAGSMGLYMIVAPQNLAKARAALVEEITKLATGGVTEAELARAKASWIQGEDTALSSDSYVAGTLNELTYQTRTFENTQQLRKRIQAVTVADLARVAKARLQPDKLVIVAAGDSSKAAAK